MENEVTSSPPQDEIQTQTQTQTQTNNKNETTRVGDKNSRFPCIEQPTRVTLHCNSYYMWANKRNGKVTCRRKRHETDEFQLLYESDGSTLRIQHYKSGGILTVVKNVLGEPVGVTCVKSNNKEEDLKLNNDNDKEEEEEEENVGVWENVSVFSNSSKEVIKEEDQKWCFIKDPSNNNAIMLKSLSNNSLNLGIDANGTLLFANDTTATHAKAPFLWTIECVTGELCFLSNPALNIRVRCDMTGLLSLSDNTKGWEVFRFMEAGHGYVKISSWMHSQWLLCCTADGRVDTCSHAESFLDYRSDDDDEHVQEGEHEESLASSKRANSFKCSKWAIEKSPTGNGVVIRSKTHGRFLCVKNNGELRTYHPDDDENDDNTTLSKRKTSQRSVSKEVSWNSFKSSFKNSMGEAQRSMNQNNVSQRFKSSLEGAKKSMSSSMSSMATSSQQLPILPQQETQVWQLEAAHSQNYYFLSLNTELPGAKAKSIGPFPQVTTNLRKNTRIQIQRENYNVSKLCVENVNTTPSTFQYIACDEHGTIGLVNDVTSVNTEWIMEKSKYQEGGTFFRSRPHNRYLSFRKKESNKEEEATETETESSLSNAKGKLKQIINKENDREELFGSETIGMQETWKLEVRMPRAVSSDKIKTFAIGTSIAVGTTVAMPFALAGVGAVMGAIGAEVGTFATVVFAGLTGAEAIASVGAIGATAYIVFKPAENSLTDGHTNDDEAEEERAWSKRPLSNWRNW